MKKVAFITGQDGTYRAGLLLTKGYEVQGISRRASSFITDLAYPGWRHKTLLRRGIKLALTDFLTQRQDSMV